MPMFIQSYCSIKVLSKQELQESHSLHIYFQTFFSSTHLKCNRDEREHTCKGKKCVTIKAILPISVKTASLMLQHVHDSWLIFSSAIKRLWMNAKNSDFGYRALHQLFLQFLPLCERWFWKEVHNERWVESHLQNCTRKKWRNKNVKTTVAFKMFFFKSPSSLCCNELDKESFKRRSF